MVFEVSIPLYLRLTDGLRGVSRFQLQNQTLSKGKVVFNGAGGRKRLESILNFVNHGTPPPGVLLDPYVVKVGEVSVEDLQRVVEGLKGPDDDGFYHGRCPACAAGLHGRRDRGKDHFYSNPSTGQIGCFAGCKKKEVMVYFEQTNVSSEETVQTTLPPQTLSVSPQNTELVSNYPTDWKAACGFVIHPDGRFVVAKNRKGNWSNVGGKPNKHESPKTCFLRETLEEIDIDCSGFTTKEIGYDKKSKSYVFVAKAWDSFEPKASNEIQDAKLVTLDEAKQMLNKSNVSFRFNLHLRLLEKYLRTLPVSVQNAEVVSTERSESTNDKLQTPAKIIEQNEDFLVVQKYKKNGEPGTSHKLEIEELKTFAQSLASFKKGEVITIQEHYDVLGWDLVKDQGTRVITRRYHPYIAALYALGEIDVYKDGSIRRN